jgi:phosphate transport system permease protein
MQQMNTTKPNVSARQRRLMFSDQFFKWFCIISAIIVCVVLFGIVFYMGQTGFLTFNYVNLFDYFFSLNWEPGYDETSGSYGAGIFFYGTLVVTLVTLIISVPISVGIAVFLSEIAPTRLKGIIRPILDLLVGIPSVIYGFLGMTVLVPFIAKVYGVQVGEGMLAAALVLSLMVLPTISRISDDAITAVPQKYREAAYAMGCTKLQTIFFVILPAARRGIVSAIILGMTRALGETMAVVMVIGNVVQFPESLVYPTSVLTSNIVVQILAVPFDSVWSYALFMMGFSLLVVALLLIIIVRVINSRGEVKS